MPRMPGDRADFATPAPWGARATTMDEDGVTGSDSWCGGDEAPSARLAILQRLSDALGCPVERFFTPADPESRVAETAELFRLWAALDRPQHRRDVLGYVRALSAAA